jgi:hypothetical protein
MKLALVLLLLLFRTAAHAQSTLGLTLSELRSLYKRSASMTDWKQGTNSVGGKYIMFEDSGTHLITTSYFTPVSGSLEELVTATLLMGPSEKFLQFFAEDCNEHYNIMGYHKWLDTKNRINISLSDDDGIAVLRFTAWHK